MPEKILLAVDHSGAAGKAVEYVGHIFGARPAREVDITLFHVAERPPAAWFPVQKAEAPAIGMEETLQEWSAQNAEQVQRLLGGYQKTLIAAGIASTSIHLKFKLTEARPEAQRVVAALAIINEARDGGYSTVVLGRRGTSDVPELFLGGVAEKVSRHVAGATVWIVD